MVLAVLSSICLEAPGDHSLSGVQRKQIFPSRRDDTPAYVCEDRARRLEKFWASETVGRP